MGLFSTLKSNKEISWVAIYRDGKVIPQNAIKTYDDLPNRDAIIRFQLIQHGKELCSLSIDEKSKVIWRKRTIMPPNRKPTSIHILARLNKDDNQCTGVHYAFDNGYVLTHETFLTEHVNFKAPKIRDFEK